MDGISYVNPGGVHRIKLTKADGAQKNNLASELREVLLLIEKITNLSFYILYCDNIENLITEFNSKIDRLTREGKLKQEEQNLVDSITKWKEFGRTLYNSFVKKDIELYKNKLADIYKTTKERVGFSADILSKGSLLVRCYFGELKDRLKNLKGLGPGLDQVSRVTEKLSLEGVKFELPIKLALLKDDLRKIIPDDIGPILKRELNKQKLEAKKNLSNIQQQMNTKIEKLKLDKMKAVAVKTNVQEFVRVMWQEIEDAENFSEIPYISFDQLYARIAPIIKQPLEPSTLPYWGWSLLAAGAVSMGIAIGFNIAANTESKNIDDARFSDDLLSVKRKSKLDEYTGASAATYIIGGLGLAIGSTLLIYDAASADRTDGPSQTSFSLFPAIKDGFVGANFGMEF